MSKAAVWTSFWYSVRWNAHVSPRGWLRRHLGSTSRMLTPNLCAQAWEPLAELPGLPQSTLTSNFACPSVRTLVFCRSMRTTERNIRFYYPLLTPRVALPVGEIPGRKISFQHLQLLSKHLVSWLEPAELLLLGLQFSAQKTKERKKKKCPSPCPWLTI